MAKIPDNVGAALKAIRSCDFSTISTLDSAAFVDIWYSLAFAYPELHPDDVEDWPTLLRPIGIEAWRRFETGDLCDDNLYPVSACRSRILFDMEASSIFDYATGDRFFGKTAIYPPDDSTIKDISRVLIVGAEGIVESVLEPPINAQSWPDMRPDMRFYWA